MDIWINSMIGRVDDSLLTFVSKVVSFALEPAVLVFLGLVISFLIYFKVSKKDSFVFAGVLVFVGVLVKILKVLIGRVRPENMLILESGFSMPSGHSTVAVVFFGYFGYLFSRGRSLPTRIWTGVVVGAVCVFIGFTRLYLRVHWFSDIVVGLILGLFVLLVGIWVGKLESNNS